MDKIARHLVGHPQRVSAGTLEMVEIAFGQGLRQRPVDYCHALRIAQVGVQTLRECSHDVRYMEQFTGTKRPWVAGDDLLHQGRARARHANDEHRQIRRISDVRAPFEKIAVECRNDIGCLGDFLFALEVYGLAL